MGKFTALSDPEVDETIESHLRRIVGAVRSRMEPDAINLRGSFGRGEGSVTLQNGRLRFLSDYEIDVATFSPFHRSRFAQLSQQLTAEFGVETSLRWVRPDYLYRNRVGPFPMGRVPITISLYEIRYGSQTLYGNNYFNSSPEVDPNQITLISGIRLVLNRMAESLYYMPKIIDTTHDDLKNFFWINKTILAFAEALLLLWGQYHYSYEERGRLFAAMANDRLGFLNEQGLMVSDYVARATEFKLRPTRDLYTDSVEETWRKVVPICEGVFHHLTEKILGFSFGNYAEFPGQYLVYMSDSGRFSSRRHFWTLKLLDVYKYLRRHKKPQGLLLPVEVCQFVYAVVPLLFVGWAANEKGLASLLSEARRWLGAIGALDPPEPDLWNEWDSLRQQMLWAWKNFCYF